MNGVIGDLLPFAVGIAISPVPIIAVILMLLAPRAGGASVGYLLGWVAGIVVTTTVVALVLGVATGTGEGTGPSTVTAGILLLLGVGCLALAFGQWRARPKPGTQAELPTWMATIDRFTPLKAVGLGFLLSAVNPKNLAMAVAAGAVVAGGGLSVAENVVAVAVYTVVAASTVLVPVVGYLVARKRMTPALTSLRAWLEHNNAVVMAVLLLVIGAVLVGKGVGALA
ncbi:GAP family protein [Amycolatopsis carbonis]|uniref:GAP family protein n=1 Tax=Amycolatopsis carbonis TaxID=715471 RepID=A0A9Y2ICH3_9PSEU|nr:GAP family protein [Amycolatopsis sp. 2-15]WIX75963.1 GAP family protein [Amycolatopsis sp. 2-15]